MVGLILAGTPSGPRIRELVHPLRDAFAAIFFFAFGLAIDPGGHRLRRRAGRRRRGTDRRHERRRGPARRPPVPLRPPARRRHRHHPPGARRVRTDPGRHGHQRRPRQHASPRSSPATSWSSPSSARSPPVAPTCSPVSSRPRPAASAVTEPACLRTSPRKPTAAPLHVASNARTPHSTEIRSIRGHRRRQPGRGHVHRPGHRWHTLHAPGTSGCRVVHAGRLPLELLLLAPFRTVLLRLRHVVRAVEVGAGARDPEWDDDSHRLVSLDHLAQWVMAGGAEVSGLRCRFTLLGSHIYRVNQRQRNSNASL